eukprot:9507371-Lingulodinium_polyedra.AAC.1
MARLSSPRPEKSSRTTREPSQAAPRKARAKARCSARRTSPAAGGPFRPVAGGRVPARSPRRPAGG